MVLMALDHTRDFFGASGMNPRDVTEPALFLTRWVTHYCAPLFIFLAGISAFLYGTQERTTGEVSLFLLTRGGWLMAIEFTLVRLGWSFDLGAHFFVAQVIWVIGASMVVLAGLVHMLSSRDCRYRAGHDLRPQPARRHPGRDLRSAGVDLEPAASAAVAAAWA